MKNRIKELRKEHKLSQGELADLVGTTRQTITSIEVGKYTASLPLAYKIAKQFSLRQSMNYKNILQFGHLSEYIQD